VPALTQDEKVIVKRPEGRDAAGQTRFVAVWQNFITA
jgi:hypothetical protein